MRNYLTILFAIFLLIFSVFSYVFIDPNFIYLQKLYSGFAFENRLLATLIYACSICIFFIFYLVFLKKLNNGQLKGSNIKRIIAIPIIFLLFAYPAMLSYDIFNYIFTAKVLFFYHENPYVIMPIVFIGDPLLLFTHAANKIALYGPIWILLTGIPYFLSFENLLLNIIVLKFFVSLFYIGSIILIWKISKNIFSVLLFALNPLVIIETLVSSHNDITMMFFSLLALYLLIKKKIIYGIIFLLASIFIKYATLFLIPVFIYVIFNYLKNKNIKWDRIFFYASLSMLLIFFLSPIREEIYSWYFIWFLVFTSLLPKRKLLLYSSVLLSVGLMLRYIPFMLLGTYSDPTPYLKEILTFFPIIFFFLCKFLFGLIRRSHFQI